MTRFQDKSFSVPVGSKPFRDNYDRALGRIIARKCPKCGMMNEPALEKCSDCGTRLKGN